MSVDGVDDCFGCAGIRHVVYVISSCKAGKSVVAGVPACGGGDDAGRQAALVIGLDEGTEIEVGLVGGGLLLPIIHVACIGT